MKSKFYHFSSVVISIVLILTVFLSNYIPVYAEVKSYTWDELKKNVEYFITWAYSQMGTVFMDHDFSQFLSNEEAFNNYFNENHVSINDGSISIDSDFVEYLKQALREYQDEMYGYYIVKTFSLYDINADFFNNSYEYMTVANLLKKYGVIGLAAYRSNVVKEVYDLSGYLSHDLAFYQSGSDTRMAICDYNTWTDDSVPGYPLYYSAKNTIELDKPYSDFDELYDFWLPYYQMGTMLTDPSSYNTAVLFSWYQFATGAFEDCGKNRPQPYIITSNGSKIMVFKNLTALMNYSVNKRSVFVTPDFDDFTGEITGSLEDLADSIDKMADIFQQFQDALGNYENSDRLTESELEDLLKQILDAIKDGNSGNNGGSGSGSGSGSSSWTDSMINTLFGYLDLIVSYLDGILEGIENLVFFEWSDQDDDELADLTELIKAIKDDPETGSKEAADTLSASFGDIAKALTKKFPFSIPWDLHGLFTVLSGENTSKISPVSAAVPYSVKSDPTDMVEPYSVQPISINTTDLKEENHSAPYFKLPIVIERYGIDDNIIIDLEPFQSISTLSRTINSVLFALFLIKFTMRVIPFINGFNGGDSND